MQRLYSFVLCAALIAASGCGGCQDETAAGSGDDDATLADGVSDAPGADDGSTGADGPTSDDGTATTDGATTAGDGGTNVDCRGVGARVCDGECVNTQVDPDNCGGCGTSCASDEACSSGGCVDSCPKSLTSCEGTCVDLNSNNDHCGACGDACPKGKGCSAGDCVDAVPLDPGPDRCKGGGPPIEIGPVCSGRTAARTFTHGLCSCGDLGQPSGDVSTLYTDAYNSSKGPYRPDQLGGHVGANGDARPSRVDVYGNLTAAGPAGLRVRGRHDIRENLYVDNRLELDARLNVSGDAHIDGQIQGGAPMSVSGTLRTTSSCGSLGSNVTANSCTSGSVSVEPPCPCKSSERIPVQKIVDYYSKPKNNDNDVIGLDPDVFAEEEGGARRLELPCGYYHLNQIFGSSGDTIKVNGRTAIVITGSIHADAELIFALAPGATLDVFVAGTFMSDGDLWIGNPALASQSRFYVGGICDQAGSSCNLDADCCSKNCRADGTCGGTGPEFSVALTSDTVMNGLLYAPYGPFRTTDPLEMFGSIVSGDFNSSATTRIHYDRSSLELGRECPTPDPDPDDSDAGPSDGGSQDTGMTPDPDADGSSTCNALYEYCSSDSDCCSGTCACGSGDICQCTGG